MSLKSAEGHDGASTKFVSRYRKRELRKIAEIEIKEERSNKPR
jgi:hypothetical protein